MEVLYFLLFVLFCSYFVVEHVVFARVLKGYHLVKMIENVKVDKKTSRPITPIRIVDSGIVNQ